MALFNPIQTSISDFEFSAPKKSLKQTLQTPASLAPEVIGPISLKPSDPEMYNIPTKEEVVMRKCLKFFKHEFNRNIMLPVVLEESPISLRVLDWFVTNYAKQYDIIYSIQKSGDLRHFSVHSNYKAQLKTFSKRRFDPFRRRKRIYFEYAVDEGIETTVGQLNFFRWAIENKVIDYVEQNLDEIVADMNMRGSKSPKSRDPAVPHKKRELSVAATKSINQHDVKVTIKFD